MPLSPSVTSQLNHKPLYSRHADAHHPGFAFCSLVIWNVRIWQGVSAKCEQHMLYPSRALDRPMQSANCFCITAIRPHYVLTCWFGRSNSCLKCFVWDSHTIPRFTAWFFPSSQFVEVDAVVCHSPPHSFDWRQLYLGLFSGRYRWQCDLQLSSFISRLCLCAMDIG